MAVAFDEMNGVDGQIRPAYSQLSAWLSDVRPDELDFRRREAEVLFRRIGITFAVYGEADATERLIPFDVIPRILSGDRMAHAQARAGAAGQGHQRLHQGHLRQARMPARRHRPRGPGVSEPGLPAGNERPEGAARHLRAHRRASISCGSMPTPSTCWKTMHARRPASPTCWKTGRSCCGCFPELFSRHRVAPVDNYPDESAGDAAIGRADRLRGGADRRAADARRLQLGLLRALVPGRQARRRTGRGPRPLREGRSGLSCARPRGRSGST